MFRNFFEVRNTMVHERMLSEKCRLNFGWFSVFLWFFPQFWRLPVHFGHSWQVARQKNEEFDFNSGMIIDISSCGPIYCQGRPKSNSKNLKQNKKITKIGNHPKIHSSYFLGILACTMVFHTPKKFPSLPDNMVKRIFGNIHIWPRYMHTKLGRELWDTL